MAELNVEIPKQLEPAVKVLDKDELKRIVSKALREQLSEVLQFKLADEILKKSKLTDELALKFGDELKGRVAKRHGLM